MRVQYFDCLHHEVSNHCYPLLLSKLYCDGRRAFKNSGKMDKNSSQRAISELLGGIVIKCGPICSNYILAEVFSFIIKVFFNRCSLCEVKIVLISVLQCNSCNSVFFFLFPCVQDFHALVRYLNQFPSDEFLPTMSNFHLLVFLATSDMLPLKVMFLCWLRACDEITANELQRDVL